MDLQGLKAIREPRDQLAQQVQPGLQGQHRRKGIRALPAQQAPLVQLALKEIQAPLVLQDLKVMRDQQDPLELLDQRVQPD